MESPGEMMSIYSNVELKDRSCNILDSRFSPPTLLFGLGEVSHIREIRQTTWVAMARRTLAVRVLEV